MLNGEENSSKKNMKSKEAGVSLVLVALVLLSLVSMSVAVAPAAAESKSPFGFFDFLQDKQASDNDQNQIKAIEDTLTALEDDTKLMNFVYQSMADFNITVVEVNIITKKGDVLKTFYMIRDEGILNENPHGYVNVTFYPTVEQAQKALAIISSGQVSVSTVMAFARLYITVEEENAPP
jgi:hypothetical protein